MSNRVEKNQTIVASVFDRLIDDEPGVSREVAKTGNQALRDLKQAVRRDLENLLNTRRRLLSWPEELSELNTSLANYGLPDFTSSHLRAAQDPGAFLELIADTISKFEPRLKNVRVELLNKGDRIDRVLRFRIDALLHVEPISDNVSFNSAFEPAKGAFEIQRGPT
jgi:type VI secretion system protein ImpF